MLIIQKSDQPSLPQPGSTYISINLPSYPFGFCICRCIVLRPRVGELEEGDISYEDFLDQFEGSGDYEIGLATDCINILFSSGTTGDPKAIPWDHTTPIKGAMDGVYHMDVREGDVVMFPTSLGSLSFILTSFFYSSLLFLVSGRVDDGSLAGLRLLVERCFDGGVARCAFYEQCGCFDREVWSNSDGNRPFHDQRVEKQPSY